MKSDCKKSTELLNNITGGDWLYTMHGPDGVDYPNHTKFLEADLYKSLVYDHGGFEDKPPMFRVSVIFTELNVKKMELTMAFSNAEAAADARIFIKQASGESTWNRLAGSFSAVAQMYLIFSLAWIYTDD